MSTLDEGLNGYRSSEDEDYEPSGQDDDEEKRKKLKPLKKPGFLVGAVVISDDEDFAEAWEKETKKHVASLVDPAALSHKSKIEGEAALPETSAASKSRADADWEAMCNSEQGISTAEVKRKRPVFGAKPDNKKKKAKKTVNSWESGLKKTVTNNKKLWCELCVNWCAHSTTWKCSCGHYKSKHAETKPASATVADSDSSDTLMASSSSSSASLSTSTSPPSPISTAEPEKALVPTTYSNPSHIRVKEVREFAGETLVVEKTILKGSKEDKKLKEKDNLSLLLESLESKKQLTTIEKSKMDWDVSKKEEGDEEDLQGWIHSKEGYRNQQKFLEDTDTRVFEKEKAMRNRQRTLQKKQDEKLAREKR